MTDLRALFTNQSLLTLALTHRSVDGIHNNQRLEFLGDRVLGLAVADLLYATFPDEREGDMARRHAALVCGDMVADVARDLGLDQAIIIAAGEQAVQGEYNKSTLGDSCEALIGALYLDSGYDSAAAFIRNHWKPRLHRAKRPPRDAKTALQEWAQADGLPLPDYRVTNRDGPAHAPEFTITVTVHGFAPVHGIGASKRMAQQDAATQFLHARNITF